MGGAVLLVGTRKGLWVGRSEDRDRWTWSPPEFLMQGIYGLGVDDRGDVPRLFAGGTSEHWGPGRLLLRRPGRSWTETHGRGRPVPRPTWAAASSGSGRSSPSADRARRGLGRHPALGAVPLRGPRRVLQPGPLAVGPPAPRGVGGRLRRPGDPHRRAAPRRPAAGDGGDVDRRGLPDRRRRRRPGRRPTGASRPTSSPTRGRSSASACTRWPRTRRPRSGCSRRTTTASTAPTTAGDRWVSIAEGLPADFGFPVVVHPHRPETVYVFPLVADGARIPPEGRARVWRSDDAGQSWTARRGPGCRTTSGPPSCATR